MMRQLVEALELVLHPPNLSMFAQGLLGFTAPSKVGYRLGSVLVRTTLKGEGASQLDALISVSLD